MLKIAFFDVDGTLLPLGQKRLSTPTRQALLGLREHGVKIAMATGRGVLTMPRFEGVDFDVYLTFNGSYCFMGDEVIHTCPIPRDDVMRLVGNLDAMGRAAAISNEHYVVCNGVDDNLVTYLGFGSARPVIVDDFYERLSDDIYQLMVSCSRDEHERILEGTHGTAITAWWDRGADIIPSSSGKGIAVRRILDYLNIDQGDAIAFGDGENDMEMFEAVGTGIAMGNAPDNVKEAADTVCLSDAEDGVYHYCVEHRLI